MAMYKVIIEERRQKTIFIEAPNKDLAISQYDAGVFGDLPEEDNDKFVFRDIDSNLSYDSRLVDIKEAKKGEEEKYPYHDVVYWDEKHNCQTTGWCD